MGYSVWDTFKKKNNISELSEEKLRYKERIIERMKLSSPNNGDKTYYYDQTDKMRILYKIFYVLFQIIAIAALLFIMTSKSLVNTYKDTTALTAAELLILFYISILIGNQLVVKKDMTKLKCSLCVWQFRVFTGIAAVLFLAIMLAAIFLYVKKPDGTYEDIACAFIAALAGILMIGMLVMDLKRKVLRIPMKQVVPDINTEIFWDFTEGDKFDE